VQESITDDGDEGATNNTTGGNGKPDSGLSESEESSGVRFRDMLEDTEAATEDVAAEDKVCEVLNRSAQKGIANPPNKQLSGLLLNIGGDVLVWGMSKTESVRKRQKHVVDWMTQFVKLDVFCCIKIGDWFWKCAASHVFKVSDAEWKCLQWRIEHKDKFVWTSRLKKLVRISLAKFREPGEQFYTIDEFCMLRRATTEREQRAFFWFFDTFLECVRGAKYWKKAKVLRLVLDAVDEDGRRKLVTKSNEAFGLLLINNYIDRWSTTLTNVARAEMTTEKDADADPGMKTTTQKRKTTEQSRWDKKDWWESTQQIKVDIANMVGGASGGQSKQTVAQNGKSITGLGREWYKLLQTTSASKELHLVNNWPLVCMWVTVTMALFYLHLSHSEMRLMSHQNYHQRE